MKLISTDTKTFKLFTALREGDIVTAATALKRFGIKNVSAEASRLRQHGFAVYADSRKAGNGVNVTEYSLGRPSRDVVAAGYRAISQGMIV